ncbi:EpsG family protein [Leucothrix pacifica]|uniref:EpsG family protein n=1 Tax=Leucothrix pacifica TaxID=1247513 RepID=A0A317CB66_9GAMM|nr:hypothetical protein DKW60_13935 [Leucothrix pacifica]
MNFFITLWSLAHVLSIILILKNTKYFYSVIVLTLLSPLILTQKFTGDVLISYVYQLESQAANIDYFFQLVYNVIGFLLPNMSVTGKIMALQLLISFFMIWSYKAVLPKENIFFVASICILSVSHFLSTENVLRQGLATCFIIFLIVNFRKRKYFRSFFFLVVAQSFHWSSALFIVPIVIYNIFREKIESRLINKKQIFKIRRVFLYLIYSFFATLVLYVIFPEYFNLTTRNSEVDSGLSKVLPLFFIYVLSTYYWMIDNSSINLELNIYRTFFFAIFLMLTLVDQTESASRILFFNFTIEALLILCNISAKNMKVKLLSITIVVIYGFVPNVQTLLKQMDLFNG